MPFDRRAAFRARDVPYDHQMVIWVPPATYHTPRHGRCEHAVEGDVPAESVEHPRPGREPGLP